MLASQIFHKPQQCPRSRLHSTSELHTIRVGGKSEISQHTNIDLYKSHARVRGLVGQLFQVGRDTLANLQARVD